MTTKAERQQLLKNKVMVEHRDELRWSEDDNLDNVERNSNLYTEIACWLEESSHAFGLFLNTADCSRLQKEIKASTPGGNYAPLRCGKRGIVGPTYSVVVNLHDTGVKNPITRDMSSVVMLNIRRGECYVTFGSGDVRHYQLKAEVSTHD